VSVIESSKQKEQKLELTMIMSAASKVFVAYFYTDLLIQKRGDNAALIAGYLASKKSKQTKEQTIEYP